MEGVSLDENAAADDGVHGAGHGEELGGVGELVGAGHFFDEDVIVGYIARFGSNLM